MGMMRISQPAERSGVPATTLRFAESAGLPPADPTPGGEAEQRWRSAPVACSLSGDDLGDRVAAWRAAVDGAARSRIADGLRLTLPADRAGAVATLAVAEQRCCSFFDFRLHLDGQVLHLEVRAPADGAGPLADLFGAPD